MRAARYRHGALTLDTGEATVVFSGDEIAGLKREVGNRAKQLIEDFMIAANTATATFLERDGYPSVRRILRAPARWDRIVTLARGLGESLPGSPDAPALQAFLLRRQTADRRFPDLSLAVVKLLGAGEYAIERPGRDGEGHFGLAVKDYTHSTAPNRRFADLITHRLLKAAMTKAPVPVRGWRAGRAGEALHRAGEQRRQGRAPGAEVRRGPAARLAHRRAVRGHHHRGVGQGRS